MISSNKNKLKSIYLKYAKHYALHYAYLLWIIRASSVLFLIFGEDYVPSTGIFGAFIIIILR